MTATVIEPRVGIGPFRLGMTRDEAWSRTRSPIRAFFAQSWFNERSDDVQDLAIHADYENGRISRLVAFTSNRPYVNELQLSLFEQVLGPNAGVDDIEALLELQELAFVRGNERLDVAELGLTFGFIERGDGKLQLEWICVEAAGRDTPFTVASSPDSRR